MDGRGKLAEDSSATLHLGDLDLGIQVRQAAQLHLGNINGAFPGGATGILAGKCIGVGMRGVWTVEQSDAVVLYQDPDPVFMDYVEGVLGHRPRVFAPTTPHTDLSIPLSIVGSVLADHGLMRQLKRYIKTRRSGVVLKPFISHALVHELGSALGIPVQGLGPEAVRAGAVLRLNGKDTFKEACRNLEIPVLPGVVAVGKEQVLKAAQEQFDQTGSLMLRQSHGAGGLGNHKVDPGSVSNLRAHLEANLDFTGPWGTDHILVEPLLDVAASPGVLAKATRHGVEIISVADQVLDADASYIGGCFPSTLPANIVQKMIDHTLRYGEYVQQEMAADDDDEDREVTFNVDFVLLGDETLLACESNGRQTAQDPVNSLRAQLGVEENIGHWTNDALVLKHPGVTFADVLAVMDPDVLWCPRRRNGVVVTIPPVYAGKGSMGYVAFGDPGHKRRLQHYMDTMARNLTPTGRDSASKAKGWTSIPVSHHMSS